MCKRLNAETLPEYIRRVEKITSGAQRKWGKLEPNELLAHLAQSIDISLGLVPQEDKANILFRTVGRRLIFDLPIPWPKGKIKAPPGFFPDHYEDLEKERAKAIDALQRFVAALTANPNRLERSAYFGPLPLSYWAKIHGKHMEHHLKQFGV